MRSPRFCIGFMVRIAVCLWALPVHAATTFRVATFNLENFLLSPVGTRPGKPSDGQAQIQNILFSLQADVVALQEIGGQNALLELKAGLEEAGLHYPHWEHITAYDTNIQIALLSRFPITARRPHTRDSYLLLGRRFRVNRGFLEIDIQVTPHYSFTLLSAHLKSRRRVSYADEAEMREQEALLLRGIIDQRLSAQPNANLLLLGDFNDVIDSPPVRSLIGKGRHALVDTRPAERNGDTDPHPNPRYDPRRITWTHHFGKEDTFSRIDYILLSRGMSHEWLPDQTYIHTGPNWGTASDHRPIIATFSADDR